MGRRRIPETDRISNVPPSIIETILCLLPIQEAARTSILSRDWRYHWVKIPKLVFDKNSFQASADETELSILEQTFGRQNRRKVMDERCKVFYAIYQILLLHEGPIHEFTLSMTADNSFVEIDHCLCEYVSFLIISAYEFYLDVVSSNAFSDEVVFRINVLASSMKDWILH
ncbi:F-box/FBD/LRR-repeat protein-like protein [Tanacetum coccineum]